MIRPLIFSVLASLALHTSAQTDALAQLAGPTSQQWTVIGNATAPKCAPGDATYTFSAKQVVVGKCTGGAWKSSTEALEVWSANGKSGIAFGGTQYVVKTLSASAPVCKGNANCVRLASVPDGNSDATRTIYLTR